jgi:dTDP-4-amino-4,6-dideoxygalactose transaminase
MGYKKGDFPIAESVFEKIISLPLYPKMTKEELNYISKTLINLIEENRKL